MDAAERDLLHAILTAETAPFREDPVIARIGDWARRSGLKVDPDAAGNLRIRLRAGRGRSPGRWVFQAHLDHPGFVVCGRDGDDVLAQFRGGVGPEYFEGARVALFIGGRPLKARVAGHEGTCDEFPLYRLTPSRAAEVPDGTIGMWDLPALRIAAGRLTSRACDDLIGVCGILCAMNRLQAAGARVDVTAVLTRGEEAGLVGAVAACEAGSVPQDAALVSIEASRALPGAQHGDGVVIRVGDRLSVFDPAVTGHLADVAAALQKDDAEFRFVRQLMTGGVCESTVFYGAGYATGALCLPLGNYHNMGRGGRIAAEYVDAGDFDCLVALLTATAQTRPPLKAARSIPSRLVDLHRQRRALLRR